MCVTTHEVIGGPTSSSAEHASGAADSVLRPRGRPGALTVRPDVHPPQVRHWRHGDRRAARRRGRAARPSMRSTRSRPAIDRPISSTCMSVCRNSRASSAPGAKVDSGTVSAPIRAAASHADQPLGAVGKQNPDPGAFADAGGQQRIGQFQRRGVGLARKSVARSSVTRNSPSGSARRNASSSGMLAGMPGADRPWPVAPRHQPTWTGMCE